MRASLEAGGWRATANGCGVEVVLERNQVGALLAALDTAAEKQLDVEIQHPNLNDLYMHTLTIPGSQGGHAGQNGRTRVCRVEVP